MRRSMNALSTTLISIAGSLEASARAETVCVPSIKDAT
jgi:hypothetical protein